MIKFVLSVKETFIFLFFFVKMLGNSRILIPSWKGETLGAAIIILHKTSKRSYLFQFLSSPCPYPLHANIFVIKHKKEGKIYIINWFGTYSQLFSLYVRNLPNILHIFIAKSFMDYKRGKDIK